MFNIGFNLGFRRRASLSLSLSLTIIYSHLCNEKAFTVQDLYRVIVLNLFYNATCNILEIGGFMAVEVNQNKPYLLRLYVHEQDI